MKEDNKIQPLQREQTATPLAGEDGGMKPAATGSMLRRMTARKWVFPAAYMVIAAVVLSLMWAYQDNVSTPVTEEESGLEVVDGTAAGEQDPQTVAVTAETTMLGWPVADRTTLEVIMDYFDANDSQEDNQAAMVEYGDTYTPHLGLDLASTTNEPFDVLAAQNGKVIRVEQVPLAGHLVEIDHGNGVSTVYQSLSNVQVTAGDEVAKGDAIAKAGRNELEKELGVHLHFEVWENGQPVDPQNKLE